MITFSCTKKVLDILKKHKDISLEREERGLFNWYVDLLVIERKTYFLFTNSETLFNFVLYAGTQKELKNIEQIFEEKLKEQIAKEIGSSKRYLINAFPKNKIYKFTKTNNRSVLGSMNDVKIQIDILHWDRELSHGEVNHFINKTPMKAIGFESPRDKMKDALDS